MNIKINGLEKFQYNMERRADQMMPMLKKATEKAVLYVHGTVPPYPPMRPMQTYKRTETLGREIYTEVRPVSGSKVIGLIGSNTVYAPWVISSKAVGSRGPQAWMHKDRWWTLQGVVKKAHKEAIQIYKNALHDLVHKVGG